MSSPRPAPPADPAGGVLGLRPSRARRAIGEALRRAGAPCDAATLLSHARAVAPRTSLASVYRTLKRLEDSGAVIRHDIGCGRSLWALAADDRPLHLVDAGTGRILDADLPGLQRLRRAAAAALGYGPADARIDVVVRATPPRPHAGSS
ncbi:Fur family transcriptional regulator [Azospirillum sp. ST 5-10]|uniref:Fur family transcriptional regulator n=1 Tax=unclassified Azospirillum TaxID=2630922 RepID=UPI003F49DB8B